MNDPRDNPTAGDYAWARADANAEELHAFKVSLAEFFAKPLGWTPPEGVDKERLLLMKVNHHLREIIARCYTASSLEEVKSIIQWEMPQ